MSISTGDTTVRSPSGDLKPRKSTYVGISSENVNVRDEAKNDDVDSHEYVPLR